MPLLRAALLRMVHPTDFNSFIRNFQKTLYACSSPIRSARHEKDFFLCVCQHAQSIRAWPFRKPPPLLSQAWFLYEFYAFVTLSTPALACRAMPHNLSSSRHRTFPQLNLHKARVRHKHGRLPSNGFIESAPEYRARAHFLPESAPPIKR